MVDIILHVGRPKTGTTAIQNFLTKNKSTLLEQGILYPHTGRFSERSNNHMPLFLSMCERVDVIQTPIVEPALPAHVYTRLLQTEIDAYNAHTVILSYETLFMPAFDKISLEHIKSSLDFARIKILAVLRDQGTMLESSFAQRVSGPQRFAGTAKEHYDMQEARGAFDYERRLAVFEAVFGRDQLHVHWYEDIRGDIMKPVRDIAQIDGSREYSAPSYDNSRASWLFIYLLRQINKSKVSGHNRNFMIRIIRRIDNLLVTFGFQKILDKLFSPYAEKSKQELRERYLDANKREGEKYGSPLGQ